MATTATKKWYIPGGSGWYIPGALLGRLLVQYGPARDTGLSLALGNYAAKTWWLKAIEAAPKFTASAQELFHAAIDAKDLDTARQMLDKIQAQLSDEPSRLILEAKYLQAMGSFADAEARLIRAIEAGRLEGESGRVGEALGGGAGEEARLALARQLLNLERISEAKPHLELLATAGVAEAAYCMGVSAVRMGDIVTALNWMERALELNPGHEQTQRQVDHLREAVGARG